MRDNTKEKMIVYLAGGFIFVAAIFPGPACAVSKRKAVSEGNALYGQGAYADSAEKYRAALENDPESDIINFDLGTALYKHGDYDGAVSYLQKTLLSDDGQLRGKGFYNLGNALYRHGMAKEKSDLSGAISSMEEAMKQYEGALAIRKDDADARHNYEFVKKELGRLRQKQEQQKKDQQDKDQQPQEKSQRSEQRQSGESPSQGGSEEQQQEQKDSQRQQGPSSEDQRKEKPPGTPKAQDEEQTVQSEPRPSQGQIPADARELTQKEARTLLESYQQNEEPQGLLDMYPRKRDAAPVLKDW